MSFDNSVEFPNKQNQQPANNDVSEQSGGIAEPVAGDSANAASTDSDDSTAAPKKRGGSVRKNTAKGDGKAKGTTKKAVKKTAGTTKKPAAKAAKATKSVNTTKAAKVAKEQAVSIAAETSTPAAVEMPVEVPVEFAAATPVRKKRGRPSKAELAAMGRLPATTVAADDASVTEKKPARPGRPKGSKNAKKETAKRGRKSKAELEALAAAAKEEVVKLVDELSYKVPNAWEAKDLNRKVVFSFAEHYKTFLDKAKTEREFIREAILLSEGKGFRNLDTLSEDHPLVPGDKVYRVVKNKLIMMAVIGTKPMTDGVRMLGAHVDSPRIDIKQNPLYEANEMGFLKTHYYGGIKKYQWAAIPLAIHGVFVKTDGTTVEIVVGEDEKDPIFTITDLLPHLAKDQYDKKLADAFAGEAMNLLLGSEPFQSDDTKDKVKFNLLRLLNETHGIKEEDFLSAELEIVPAFKARDLGLDRSMIGAYGHDDRVCAYPAMMAVLESEDPDTTSLCILTDKEEIGSVGNTGAQSRAMENFLADLCAMSATAPYTDRALRRCLDRSKMLSADVTAAVDPNYEGTHDKLNASYLGKGIAIMKYSGARGKSGASDAHAEYVAEIRKILNDAGVAWQTTELGAVDKGGGGTIAMMIANLGVDVIDCGVPVLSMHAPFEVASKVDLYNTYKAYVAFLK